MSVATYIHNKGYSHPIKAEALKVAEERIRSHYKHFWNNNKIFRQLNGKGVDMQAKELRELYDFVTTGQSISYAERGIFFQFSTVYIDFIARYWGKTVLDMILTDYSLLPEYANVKAIPPGKKRKASPAV